MRAAGDGAGDAPSAEELLGELAAQLRFPAAQGPQVRALLLGRRALVHVDNADDAKAANAAARLAEALAECPLIVTGRYTALGQGGAWTVVPVGVFDEATSAALLEAEIERPVRADERAAITRLAEALGHLPLALSLAAAHVRDGMTAEGFLGRLGEERLDLDHPDPAKGDRDERRRNVAKTLSLSRELLRASLGARAEVLLAGLRALGHAPAAGVGASLGAAISGLAEDDFRWLAVAATRLSLLERAAGDPPRWRLHPLVAQHVREESEAEAAIARAGDWFMARLPEKSDADPRPQGERWREVHAEVGALMDWLGRMPPEAMPRAEREGSWYAMLAGPFAAWGMFCERLLVLHEGSRIRSDALWTLGC